METRSKKLALGLCLASLALGLGAQAPRLDLALMTGLGYETQTGLPWAVESRLGLEASRGRLYSCATLGQALGKLDWRRRLQFQALDCASCRLGISLLDLDALSLRSEALADYQSFGSAGRAYRLGLALGLDLGGLKARNGLSFRGRFGCSRLWSRYSFGELQGDWSPTASLGLCFRPLEAALLELSLSDYSGPESGLFCKTSFRLGAHWNWRRFSLQTDASLDYTDFFTLTSCLDGYSLRASCLFPLGASELIAPRGFW